MTFPCICCNRCTARTNDGALWCLDCESLPVETQRAALERHLGMCGEQGWYEPPKQQPKKEGRLMAIVEQERVAAPVEVTEADVLERAADLLGEFGWCQHKNGSKAEGEFCISGATGEAISELGYEYGPGSRLYWLGQIEFPMGSPLWNDAPGRTKAEVVAKLREVAARARGE